jgi:hypothetical protein
MIRDAGEVLIGNFEVDWMQESGSKGKNAPQ